MIEVEFKNTMSFRLWFFAFRISLRILRFVAFPESFFYFQEVEPNIPNTKHRMHDYSQIPQLRRAFSGFGINNN